MSESRNVEFVRQMYSNLEDDDLSNFMDMIAPDVEWQYPEAAGIPYGGLHRGLEGVGEFFELHDQAVGGRRIEQLLVY
jgi:ketosteroid isomerase-like protein